MKEKTAKVKITRATVAGGKVVNKGTVLTMTESEARLLLRTGKAVLAGSQTKTKE